MSPQIYDINLEELPFDIISLIGTYLPCTEFLKLSMTCSTFSEFKELYSGRNYKFIKNELIKLMKLRGNACLVLDLTMTNIIKKSGLEKFYVLKVNYIARGLHQDDSLHEDDFDLQDDHDDQDDHDQEDEEDNQDDSHKYQRDDVFWGGMHLIVQSPNFLNLLLSLKAFNQRDLNLALITAVTLGTFEVCQSIVNHGANANCDNPDYSMRSFLEGTRWRPLTLACSLSDYQKVVLLIEHGANINHREKNGSSGLMSAIKSRCSMELFEYLINAGSDIHNLDESLRTSLHYAAFYGQIEIYSRLLELGINSELADKNGNLGVDILFVKNKHVLDDFKKLHNEYNLIARESEIVNRLLGTYSLIIACRELNYLTVCLLVEQGIDMNVYDQYGEDGLKCAISQGCSLEFFEVLIKGGSDVKSKICFEGYHGRSSLSCAVHSCQYDIYLRLMDLGLNSYPESPGTYSVCMLFGRNKHKLWKYKKMKRFEIFEHEREIVEYLVSCDATT